MNFNEYYRPDDITSYPEYVTQKEMAAILGICKSKAYSILKHGLIPFEYAGASTGRVQKIRITDIMLYQHKQNSFFKLDSGHIEELRCFYQKQLRCYPQMLLVSNIMDFTGYTRTTVNNWILRGKLNALCYKNKRIKSPRRGKGTLITKDSFIDYLTSPYYRSIVRKSNVHREQEKQYERLFIMFLLKEGEVHG